MVGEDEHRPLPRAAVDEADIRIGIPIPQLLARIADAQVAGHTRTVIDPETFTLDQVNDAFAAFAGGTLGKIVILIDQT
jgi:hypothetical protein